VFSLFMPRMRAMAVDNRPKPVTSGRQIMLVALIVIIGGYPLARWGADRLFTWLSERTAATIMADPLLLAALKEQNKALEAQSQAEIDATDRRWIEERRNPDGALTGAMLASAPSRHVRSLIANSHDTLTHAILMDTKGRNVAIAAPTTDYWQGDEAKFLATVAKGSGDVQSGSVEMRHDGEGKGCWLSRAIFDNGKPIGALSVELNLQRVPESLCAAD
jgi:hypothetical protein